MNFIQFVRSAKSSFSGIFTSLPYLKRGPYINAIHWKLYVLGTYFVAGVMY